MGQGDSIYSRAYITKTVEFSYIVVKVSGNAAVKECHLLPLSYKGILAKPTILVKGCHILKQFKVPFFKINFMTLKIPNTVAQTKIHLLSVNLLIYFQ